MTTFSAQVNQWVSKSTDRIEAVFRQSAQDVINEANKPVGQGGNLPFDTGFLHASLQTNINSAPTGGAPQNRTAAQMQSELLLNIANLRLGDTLFAVWGAAYARRLHFGFTGADSLGRQYNQSGRFWVTIAAGRWQQIVSRNSAEARRRFP